MTEENKNLNPQAEGSNTASGSKNKSKERATEGGSNFASSSRGERTIIRSKNSEQLELIKNNFENFRFSEITEAEINRKVNKTIDKITYKESAVSKTIRIITSSDPIFGKVVNSMSIDDTERQLKNQMREVIPQDLQKLVNAAISDLENQKTELIGKLANLSEQVNDRENGLLAEIDRLTLEIAKMDKQKDKLEEDVDHYKKIEQERRQRIAEALEKGYTIQSKEKLDLESLKTENKELREKLETWGEIIADLPTLKKGYDTEIQNLKHQIEEEKDKLELKQQELDNAINSLEILNQRVDEARAERDEAQKELNTLKNTKLKNKKEKIANLKDKVSDLEKELKKHEPSMLYQVAEKLGIIQLKNSISNVLIIAGAVVVLYAISWMWRYLIKPTYRNFKSDDEEEAKPRKKEKVRYADYEEIDKPREKLPDKKEEKTPTIIINNSTPAEKEPSSPAVVSKEVENKVENSTEISSKKTDPIVEEKAEVEKPAKGSKNRKKAKKKKNKKKIKGDSS